MAIEVGFFEDFKDDEHRARVFAEGPFVISNPLGNGWRVEVEEKGHKCTVMPHHSIYDFAKQYQWPEGKTWRREDSAKFCDWLNYHVCIGSITCDGHSWVRLGFL